MDKYNRYRNIWIITLACIATFNTGNYLTNLNDTFLGQIDVIFKAKILKNDTFQLFYQQGSTNEFTIANSVKTEIIGSEDVQNVIFKLPEIDNLKSLRLDIGENFKQEQIEIYSIKFIIEGKELFYNIDEFNMLFSPNKFVEVNNESTFTGKEAVLAGNRKIYDPGFYVNLDSVGFEKLKIKRFTDYPFTISAFIFLVFSCFFIINGQTTKLKINTLFLLVFFVLLILPSVQIKYKLIDPLKSLEKRELAKKPKFSFSTEFARDYETYLSDNFGFRNHLVNWGSNLKTKFFRSSTYPELVIFGKEKWLYYTRVKGRIYRSYSRTNLLQKDTLKLIVNKWESNKKKFESKGIKYVLGFWPNKHTIYPEYLSNSANMQIKDTISRIDQIVDYIDRTNATVKLTDVRKSLLKEKNKNLLYHKYDTHWNSYGAFVAYQEFFKQNKNDLGITAMGLDEFNVQWQDYYQGELISMLGINNGGFFVEKNPIFNLKENPNQIEYLTTEGYPKLTVITKNNLTKNNLRVLVFRDSFTTNLIPFFSLHFKEVYYIWGFKEEFVDQLKPDIIIDGFVEREVGEYIR